MRRFASFAIVCLLTHSAFAADDDDLAPLTPIKKQPAKAPAKKAPPPRRGPPATKHSGDDDLTPLPPLATKAELTVKLATNISGALLVIDGKEVGVLPLGGQAVAAGEHQVLVKRPGFAPFSKKVTVQVGKPLELEAKLAPVAAVLSVTSDVPDAQVLVNGRAIGMAPIADYELPPGVVEVAVTKEGFREDRQKLTLVAGKDYPVVVKFNPPVVAASDRPVETRLVPGPVAAGPLTVTDTTRVTPVYERWYFWAGVAAVVVAAAVGTTVGVTAAQPPRKRYESEICSGKCDACIALPCTGAVSSGLTF